MGRLQQVYILLVFIGLFILFITIFTDIVVVLKNGVLENRTPTCTTKKTDIVFLKMHKAASSSIQNILMRFGDRHDLLFVLPQTGNYIGHPRPFHHSMVPKLKVSALNIHYNIIAHHIRFNYHELKRVMPRNALFFTILRKPAELFESLYSYYSLENFFKTPITNFGINQTKENINKRLVGKIGRNQMSFDLGLNEKDFENVTLLTEFAKEINREFNLVMIAEQMDESLVLLKNLLCWETDDIIVFKLNARENKFVKPINSRLRLQIEKFNYADLMLYNFFKDKLAEKIKNFGVQKLAAGVKELRERRDLWFKYCVQGENLVTDIKEGKKPVYRNSKVTKLKAREDNDTCVKMTEEELIYTDMLREKQKTFLL
ncbi:galactosylceramide sulfotransferase-like [Tachypleus tridentatus]|uniref:galactosylceramide sulfotransferase-like n=1 Tax=Tachypleus tridentatus TaxID=6853 RepID=UPI003FCEF334